RPVEERPPDRPGPVETVLDQSEQPCRERRAESGACARLAAKVTADRHDADHTPAAAPAPARWGGSAGRGNAARGGGTILPGLRAARGSCRRSAAPPPRA